MLEIIIVASIICLLAGLSIVMYLNAYISGNESAAQSALHVMRTAMEKYRGVYFTYPLDLATLGSQDPPYIDTALAGGTRGGYNYVLTNASPNTYTVTATPVTVNITGKRTFFVDETGVIQES